MASVPVKNIIDDHYHNNTYNLNDFDKDTPRINKVIQKYDPSVKKSDDAHVNIIYKENVLFHGIR